MKDVKLTVNANDAVCWGNGGRDAKQKGRDAKPVDEPQSDEAQKGTQREASQQKMGPIVNPDGPARSPSGGTQPARNVNHSRRARH